MNRWIWWSTNIISDAKGADIRRPDYLVRMSLNFTRRISPRWQRQAILVSMPRRSYRKGPFRTFLSPISSMGVNVAIRSVAYPWSSAVRVRGPTLHHTSVPNAVGGWGVSGFHPLYVATNARVSCQGFRIPLISNDLHWVTFVWFGCDPSIHTYVVLCRKYRKLYSGNSGCILYDCMRSLSQGVQSVELSWVQCTSGERQGRYVVLYFLWS